MTASSRGRASTTAIHRVDMKASATRCGLTLSRPVGSAIPLPRMRARESGGDIKVTTSDLVANCQRCAKKAPGATARVDARADAQTDIAMEERRLARGAAVEVAIADDTGRPPC